MLSCREMSERASELVEGRARWPERLGARLHLLMCDYCRRYFEQLRLTIATFRRVRRPTAPVDTAKVLARIAAQPKDT